MSIIGQKYWAKILDEYSTKEAWEHVEHYLAEQAVWWESHSRRVASTYAAAYNALESYGPEARNSGNAIGEQARYRSLCISAVRLAEQEAAEWAAEWAKDQEKTTPQ